MLYRAIQSPLPSFQSFADWLLNDYAAVKAGVTLPSTGPVEGHIHRLKLLKRDRYSRASIDLLCFRRTMKFSCELTVGKVEQRRRRHDDDEEQTEWPYGAG